MLGKITTSTGLDLILSAATETSQWNRPDFAATQMKAPLENAVQKNESVLPANTKEVCLRLASRIEYDPLREQELNIQLGKVTTRVTATIRSILLLSASMRTGKGKLCIYQQSRCTG